MDDVELFFLIMVLFLFFKEEKRSAAQKKKKGNDTDEGTELRKEIKQNTINGDPVQWKCVLV